MVFSGAISYRDEMDRPFCGPLASFMMVLAAGFMSGYISKFGFDLSEPEFSVIWNYPALFAGIFASAISLKKLNLFPRFRRSQKVAVN
jgi:hypothetical protein